MGLIKPLYKTNSSTDDVDNYKGIITLLSCWGELFAATINACLSQYCEYIGIFGDVQAGVCEGHSITDRILLVHAIVNLY